MEIIKDIKITNYKGLEEVQFPCGSVNILVGPNNTGKTSILESIFMSVSSLSHFEDVLETRLFDIFNTDARKNMKYFINQGNEKSTIELTLLDNKIILDLLYVESGYPQEVAENFLNFMNKNSIRDTLDSNYQYSRKTVRPAISELIKEIKFLESALQGEDSLKNREPRKLEVEKMLKLMSERLNSAIEEYRTGMIKSKKLILTSKLNNTLRATYVRMDDYVGEIPIVTGYVGDNPIVFDKIASIDYNIPIIMGTPKIDYDMSTLHKKLVKTRKIRTVLETLKNRIPYFEDIREVEGDYFVSLENLKESIPLSFMGDGFKALLKLSFMASLVKNGIVLFEEPETSMHPSYMDILAREIIINSSDAQFFISTHSSEFLERILEKAEKLGKLESIKILKLRRLPEGYIEREYLSGKEAKEEIESIKTDLRGF